MSTQIVTPTGKAHYPYISKPDTGHKFSGNNYKVSLELSPEDAEPIIAIILAETKAGMEEAKRQDPKAKFTKVNKPYKNLVDAEGNETGNILISFKSTIDYKPAVFDAAENYMDKSNIYGGSLLNVSGYCGDFYNSETIGCGVVLRLKAVQIIHLVEGPTDSDSFGFTPQEGFRAAGTTDSGEAPTEEAQVESPVQVADSPKSSDSDIDALISDIGTAKTKAKNKVIKKTTKSKAPVPDDGDDLSTAIENLIKGDSDD